MTRPNSSTSKPPTAKLPCFPAFSANETARAAASSAVWIVLVPARTPGDSSNGVDVPSEGALELFGLAAIVFSSALEGSRRKKGQRGRVGHCELTQKFPLLLIPNS